MARLPDTHMLIDGKLVPGSNGDWADSINPSDETVVGRSAVATPADVDHAVDAANRAWPAWNARSVAERGEIMRAFGEAIAKRSPELARIEVMDSGNTLKPTLGAMDEILQTIRFYAGIAPMLRGETIPATPNNLHMTIHEPYGVVGRIAAYNHPALFSVGRTAAAMVAGNAVVVKPPETCPLSVLTLGEIATEMLPPGVFNIVSGDGKIGDALTRHPKVKRLALIGSVQTGEAIQRSAAEVAVKHITLELGGKNPMIVFPDVDLAKAAASAVAGMNFPWQGQSCGSNSRLIVHADIYDEMVERVTSNVAAIRVGDPLGDDTDMGPINSSKSYDHVMSFLDPDKTKGARLMTGGARPDGREFKRGYWVRPTVFAYVTPDMRLWREEVFGPILSIARWYDEDEMIALANDTDFGLSAAIWTNNISAAIRTARRIRAGSIFINGSNKHIPGMPWGGFKNSGVDREEGMREMQSYMETKAINIMM